MTLTLQEIRDHSPCQSGWKTLTKAVGNDMTTKLSIGDVVISNGLNDALWCFRCLEPRKRVAAIMPTVKRAAVHSKDQRVHSCIKDIEKWLSGDDSVDLDAAVADADAAAEAAEWAAAEAAWAAEWAAADAAAWAAWAAADAAAKAAADAAARGAREAERELQKSDLLKMFPPMILKGETK